MMWRVEGSDGRWAAHDEQGFTGDDETRSQMRDLRSTGAVPLSPTGGQLVAGSDPDPSWFYAGALYVVPAPHKVTGTPPELPENAGEPGTVY